MPKKNVPGPSALASTNFSAVDEPVRTLYTNGVLALPTINTPPGATVRLSGCDVASAIRISAPNAALAKPNVRTIEAARRAFKRPIIKSPRRWIEQKSVAIHRNVSPVVGMLYIEIVFACRGVAFGHVINSH